MMIKLIASDIQYTIYCSLVMLIFFSCNSLEEGNEGEELLALEEIVQVAQQRSINRHSVDWDALQTEILEVRNSDGFDEAISVFLKALGDNQSFYSRLNGRNIFATEANCSGSPYDFGGLADNIGYIQMRAFLGNNTQATLFAGDRHNRAKTQDGPDIRGWVIDLTTTNGGSIYPVIASLGPFYHQEVLGYFIDADENHIPWGYADDGAFIRTTAEKQTVVSDPYTLMDSDAKLVVVIDLATAGAGEAALIALKNRPNTLVLGRPTCGLAAVTESFTLSNSDILVLATNYIADSDKQTYPGRLMPDEQIGNTDDLLARIDDFIGN